MVDSQTRVDHYPKDKTVLQIVQECNQNRLWLCPHSVTSSSFQLHAYLKGFECTKSTLPDELKDKVVKKIFMDSGILCIIWENDGSFY